MLFSNEAWLHLSAGTWSYRLYVAQLLLVCGVLWVQLGLLANFFLWDHKLTPMCYTNCDTIFDHLSDYEKTLPFYHKTATSHTESNSMLGIENTIDERTLSRVLWPQHLPDINLYDLYLRDMWKNKVCSNSRHIEHDLKRMNSEFSVINFTMESTCAMQNVCVRCDIHLQARGHHFLTPSLNKVGSKPDMTCNTLNSNNHNLPQIQCVKT